MRLTRLLEKVFMTGSRKGGIVRVRCLQFIDGLKREGFTHTLPLEEARLRFQLINGVWDERSLQRYFGVQPGQSSRRINKRTTNPTSGTVSFKLIELSQSFEKRAGYLELLGLVSIDKRGPKWFLTLEGDLVVAPELNGPRALAEEEQFAKVFPKPQKPEPQP